MEVDMMKFFSALLLGTALMLVPSTAEAQRRGFGRPQFNRPFPAQQFHFQNQFRFNRFEDRFENRLRLTNPALFREFERFERDFRFRGRNFDRFEDRFEEHLRRTNPALFREFERFERGSFNNAFRFRSFGFGFGYPYGYSYPYYGGYQYYGGYPYYQYYYSYPPYYYYRY